MNIPTLQLPNTNNYKALDIQLQKNRHNNTYSNPTKQFYFTQKRSAGDDIMVMVAPGGLWY